MVQISKLKPYMNSNLAIAKKLKVLWMAWHHGEYHSLEKFLSKIIKISSEGGWTSNPISAFNTLSYRWQVPRELNIFLTLPMKNIKWIRGVSKQDKWHSMKNW